MQEQFLYLRDGASFEKLRTDIYTGRSGNDEKPGVSNTPNESPAPAFNTVSMVFVPQVYGVGVGVPTTLEPAVTKTSHIFV